MKHNRTRLLDRAYITRLLLEFPHGTLLRCLAFINQSSRYLDRDFVDRRSELFLEQNFGALGRVEDGDNADAVDRAVFGAGLQFHKHEK